MLTELDTIPEGLLGAESHELWRYLEGPTLFHLRGRREPALFVSVLMHGNEPAGWEAVRELLRTHANGPELPRSMSLFIGNVAAAAEWLRHLEGQPDYNRIWPGSTLPETPEHRMMQSVVDTMAHRGVFASVDIHNNTGLNPHYACVNLLDNRFLHLATLFSRTVVYFLRPKGVQSMAMAALCPAVTLECGKVGQAHGVTHARGYLEGCLHLSAHPEHPVAVRDIDLFHTVAQVKIPEPVSFGFEESGLDLSLAPGLDHLNFRELPRGTSLGQVKHGNSNLLDVRDEQGRDVADQFFLVEDDELRTRVPVMPSMLSKDEDVIRQDCLCYLMERYDSHIPLK